MSNAPKTPSPYVGLAVGAAFGVGAFTVDHALLSFLLGSAGVLTIAEKLGHLPQYLEMERRRKLAETPTGTFGTARWATLEDCRAAGLTDPDGIFLGCLDGIPLFFNGKAHGIIEVPARQGKGVNFVVPNLLHTQSSACVLDPKGELAAMTAQHRADDFGQKVYLINPWGLHGLPQHRFNPIGHLIETYADPATRRSLTQEVHALVMQLLPEPEGEQGRFFREGSRHLLRALLLLFAVRGEPERCTLVELWRVLQSPSRLVDAVAEMAESDALGGMLIDFADDLSNQMKEKPVQFADFREGARQTVAIYDPAGWLAESVSGSDFTFADLKRGKATIYLMVPSEALKTYGAWMGLLTRRAFDDVARTRGPSKVLFLLDEVANMGRLEGLIETLTLLPGLGVRVWFVVQAMEQLEVLYGREATQVILSQAEVKQFFSVQSTRRAQDLSAACGQRTVKTLNINLGRELDADAGESVGETGRPLIAPEEIMQLAPPAQLLFVKNLPPIKAERVPYWCVAPWRDWARDNPIEGPTPQAEPAFRLTYRERR